MWVSAKARLRPFWNIISIQHQLHPLPHSAQVTQTVEQFPEHVQYASASGSFQSLCLLPVTFFPVLAHDRHTSVHWFPDQLSSYIRYHARTFFWKLYYPSNPGTFLISFSNLQLPWSNNIFYNYLFLLDWLCPTRMLAPLKW